MVLMIVGEWERGGKGERRKEKGERRKGEFGK
jgi:hypothetical protein